LKAAESPVKRLALAKHLDVYQPPTLNAPGVLDHLRAVRPDVLVVAAYGLLLPRQVLEIAPHGALNIHASLLPRWRGAAPIQRAILAGDRETGVSIMLMDAGLDTGPVLSRKVVPIAPDEDAGTLHDKLAALGAEEVVAALAEIEAGRARATSQSEHGVTYAPKIQKQETRLDWAKPAGLLERAVRAFRPFPGASTRLNDAPLKVWRSHVVAAEGPQGRLLEAGDSLVVGCGEGALALDEVQPASGRRMSAHDYIRGHRVAPGARLG
jgi:methionyl-tRNA formyltransferase